MCAPSPYELWKQANGDAERYVELMREHGHIIDHEPGDNRPVLPCGRPERRLDPFQIMEDSLHEQLHEDLAEMARKRRRAEAEAANVVLP